jgi:hypothetical protein
MLDIPPRIRRVLTVAAAGGLIFIIIGSLATGSAQQIGLDKLIHGTGYALLGLLTVLGLPPIWYLPALIGIVGAGIGLEFAQKTVIAGRSFELDDVVANSTGLVIGMCAGFLLRMLWRYVGGEMAARAERKRLRRYADGQVIFKQGDPSHCFYIIRRGAVEILVTKDGAEISIARASRGEVLGEMGVIENLPRSATAVARGKTVLYRLERSDLEPSDDTEEHPAMIVARTLAARLRTTTLQVAITSSAVSPTSPEFER